MEALAGAIEANGLVAALRASRYAYPLVNAVHLLGLAALFGSILVLDARMLGLGTAVPVGWVEAIAVPVAVAGFVVAVTSGAALFAVRAGGYIDSPVFLAKIAFVAVGTANAAIARATGLSDRMPRVVAAISVAAWTGAIVAGRMIGYIED